MRLFLATLIMLTVLTGNARAQSFSDDFNRPDGVVGNGWGTWNGTTLSNGQVMTFGSNGAGGGIYRSFPLTFPVTFGFDFRTESPHPSCDIGNTSHPGGGWLIAFNAPGGGYAGAQYEFYQYYGSQPVNRHYLTSSGPVDDAMPSGLGDFGSSFAHISGIVNADFSATLSIGGNTYHFPASANPAGIPTGANLVLSNSSCGAGPFFFDNLSIQDVFVPPSPSDSFQIRYAAHLNIGDSFVNITNTGASNSANLCANIYTFDPAEELISCCTCSVTPNGLQSLSILKSLISNPLTPAIPTALVVKVVTTAGAVTCNAASAAGANLAHGLVAWGTTLHANTSSAAASYSLTEAKFSNAVLSDAELAHITSTCGFIQSNGSGFGICKGCATGGLGSSSSNQ